MADLLSRENLDFLLYDCLDVESLTKRPRFAGHDRATFDAVIDLATQVATEKFAPSYRELDTNEPTFDGAEVHLPAATKVATEAYRQTGFAAATFDHEVGGMQLPFTIATGLAAWFQAANVAASAYSMLTMGAANLLVAHASAQQIDTYARPLIQGDWFATMCLSEPEAGSSLGDLTTKAIRSDDGTYRLSGTKMWISGGEHSLSDNIIHLVLAKVPGGPAGAKGISLFIVPKVLVEGPHAGERNDVVLAGLNHKMGYRGTVNTLLNFGEGVHQPGGVPGAVGYLVGEENAGLAAMFHMMNEARISVGAGAVALGSAGYLKSLRYARERRQGRRLGEKDPTSDPVALVEHADVRRMLLAQKAYVEGGLALTLYCGRLVDETMSAPDAEDRARAQRLLDLLTPIAKSFPSQWCLEANSLAIQILGGYGYTRDFDVEQHYRDNRLNPIHEGTHGIQGLDLLGRKVVIGGGQLLGELLDVIAQTVSDARDLGGDLAELASQLDDSAALLASSTAAAWSGGDPARTLANASTYLEAAGHVVVAWLWLWQAVALDERSDDFALGKRQAARFFFAYELPKVGPWLALVARADATTLEMRDEWF